MLNDQPASPFDALCAQVEREMERLRVPGVALAVLYQGETRAAAFGVTNIAHPLPVTADTLFQIGSITKTFVATAAMRLAEAGQLDLDAPVRQYLPELRLRDETATARVTMRHLLTHTGGWLGDYFDDFGWGDDALARYVAAMAKLPQLTPVGSLFHYNNAGFNLAGRVIEAITGQTFESAMVELVLASLGLEMTFFYPWDAMLHRFVVGHTSPYDADEPVSLARPWPIGRSSHPAGGIISTVDALMRYAQFHLTAGGVIHEMQAPLVQTTLAGDWRGLSWMVRQVGEMRIIGHGGATKGQQATLQLCPAAGFAIAVLTNSDRGSELHGTVTTAAFNAYLGAVAEAPVYLALSSDALIEYAGRYTAPLNDVTLDVGDGALKLQLIPKGGFPRPDSPPGPTPPPACLAFASRDLAYVADGPGKDSTVEFLRDSDGRIIWLRMGGRVHRRVEG